MSINDHIDLARTAILKDLAQRFKSGDKAVTPLRPENSHRWHMPQDNYYAGEGEISCPICPGTLNYHRSAYNGHISATCSTQGCLIWRE